MTCSDSGSCSNCGRCVRGIVSGGYDSRADGSYSKFSSYSQASASYVQSQSSSNNSSGGEYQ